MYSGSSRVDPTIPAFKAVAVVPAGTGNKIVTIAPKL
jgi:hypothetical protein